MLLPLVLIFMTMLVNKKYLMKEWTNSRVYNFVSWTAVAVMIGLTVALVGISLQDLSEALTVVQAPALSFRDSSSSA